MRQKTPFGYAEPLFRNKDIEVAKVTIAPGKEIGPEFHKKMREVEVVVGGRGRCNGKTCKEGDLFVWPPNKVHHYKNDTKKSFRFLCITSPPFDIKDVFNVK